jgi:hypothetical protein
VNFDWLFFPSSLPGEPRAPRDISPAARSSRRFGARAAIGAKFGRARALAAALVFAAAFWGAAWGGDAAQGQEPRALGIDSSRWPEVQIEVAWPEEGDVASMYSLRLEGSAAPLAPTAFAAAPGRGAGPFFTLFAVDTSRSLNPATLLAIKDSLRYYAAEADFDAELALVSFNDSVQLLTSFTSDRERFVKSIDGLALNGKITELYKSMLFALELLKNFSGFKLLVVFSDGKDEGTEVSALATLKLASDRGIEIAAIGLETNNPADASYRAVLEKFAVETGGLYRLANNGEDVKIAVFDILKAQKEKIAQGRSYSMTFTVDPAFAVAASPVAATLTRAASGDAKSVAVAIVVPPAILAKRGDGASPESGEGVAPDSFAGFWEPILNEPLYLTLFVLAAVLLLCLPLFFFVRKRKGAGSKPGAGKPSAKPGGGLSPFVLNFIDLGLKESLRLGVLTLGANPQNDVRVDVMTVSGRHAELKVTSTECRIKDLNSTNGTKVNGAALRSSQVLKDGDALLFGTAKAVFTVKK